MKQITRFLFVCLAIFQYPLFAQPVREHLLMDRGWRFAFGHPYDTKQDFDNGTGYFSYFTKAGYGDGAASAGFDDRSWRILDLPHDWAVEQPFDEKGSLSHGFKAVGRNFPNTSVGWYRKRFKIPASDLGRHISIAFDGVYRNSIVWVNGHYLGTQASGYMGFEYDISAYLNYGGENLVAVRADATMQEGWFYEGTGIYRHVWLNKTNALHLATNGNFVTTTVGNASTVVNVKSTISNDTKLPQTFDVQQVIVDASGKEVSKAGSNQHIVQPRKQADITMNLQVSSPVLWDLDHPYLYRLKTTIIQSGVITDSILTLFGIRTIRFDNNAGFFLNGKHLKIQGTNNHQDHAGVGAAMPDALQDFRIKTLKSFGSNAYRCSHNPPTPELLDACDRLGMLVIDEHRLMGTTQTHLNELQQLIERDRNHPSIISWSIGNEEWGIENDITGARIADNMQAFVNSLDSTRPVTAAFSGGIGSNGITTVMELIGINYIANKSTDEQHRLFPNQWIWGTEEGSTHATRGAYFRDDEKHVIPAYDKPPNKVFLSIENGWKHYATRDYLAGMFIWTGFDYRGEPTPYGWPSIASYFGMVDLCGFAKDNTGYLKSWWTKEPTLHILPHWNWAGKEGQPIDVWAYSNCDEVELLLNKKSLGKQTMPRNGHLEWKVKYQPGTLEAIGYTNGKKILTDRVQTTGDAVAVHITADRDGIFANHSDISILTIKAKDAAGRDVPTANDELEFSISGPGRIIGVGNGNPTSLEPDQFLPKIREVRIEGLKEKAIPDFTPEVNVQYDHNDGSWKNAFTDDRTAEFAEKTKVVMYSGHFTMPALTANETVTFFYDSLGKEQSIYINGKPVAVRFNQMNPNGYTLDAGNLHEGQNTIVIMATPFVKQFSWSSINTNPGLIQIVTPAKPWKRRFFNGLAQVIVQSTGGSGQIKLLASSGNLKPASVTLAAVSAASIPSVD